MQSVQVVFKKLNTDIGVKVETNKMTLIITQAMCCYFISSFLQMSLNLPAIYKDNLFKVIPVFDFEVFLYTDLFQTKLSLILH